MKAKDLNKRLRELREGNTFDTKWEKVSENILDRMFPRRIKASEEKAMLNESGRKTFQETLAEKMGKIAVLEKEIYKRN